jgi:hypothetical protein
MKLAAMPQPAAPSAGKLITPLNTSTTFDTNWNHPNIYLFDLNYS